MILPLTSYISSRPTLLKGHHFRPHQSHFLSLYLFLYPLYPIARMFWRDIFGSRSELLRENLDLVLDGHPPPFQLHDLTKEGGVTYGLSDSPLHAVRDALAMRTCSSNLGGAEESYEQAVDSNKTHRYRAQWEADTFSRGKETRRADSWSHRCVAN